ncbi:unnamed protein product [Alopecurus aequalis]
MAEPTTTILPEDVVHKILLRLDDVATLFRCATTCKNWRRLVAKPYFLLRRQQWPPSLVVGFFTKRRLSSKNLLTTRMSPSQLAFVPLPGPSMLGNRPRALSSFVFADAAVVNRAMPLSMRGGLLMRLGVYPRRHDLKRNTFSLAPVCNPTVHLAVCNPVAGTWDVLPKLNCQTRFGNSNIYGSEIVPTIAGDGTTAFKVLMIGKDKDKSQYNLHTFASGEARWRAPTKCFDMMEREIWLMKNTTAVMCRGYAHWLFVSESNHFHVLNVDVETGHVSLTKLLSLTYEPHIAMANNQRVNGLNRPATTTDGTRLSLYV